MFQLLLNKHYHTNFMKNFMHLSWLRYAIVFILLIILNSARWRLLPNDDPEGGNLLINVILASMGTAAYIAIEYWWQHSLRKCKKS